MSAALRALARRERIDPGTRRYVGHFLRSYPRRTALMVLALGFAALADGLGLLALLPVLELAIGADAGVGGAGAGEAALSAPSRWLSAGLERLSIPTTLPTLLGLIVVSFAIKGALNYAAMRQVGFAVANVGHDLRLSLLDALVRARWSHVESRPVGHVANAVSSETHRASWGYQSICSAIAELLQILVYLGIVAAIAWPLALALPVAAAAVALAFGPLISMSRQAGHRSTDHLKDLVGRLAESLGGLKGIKAMGLERASWSLMTREATEFRDAQRRTVIAREAVKAFHEPLVAVLLAALLWAALAHSSVDFATLLLLAALFQRLMSRASLLQGHYQSVLANESAFLAVHDQVERARELAEPGGGRLAPPPLAIGIELEGVGFGHAGRPVLDGLDARFAAGELHVVTGPSGAGKSTLLDLLLALRVPDAGRVLVDGVPLADVDVAAWRRSIGFVAQEPLLFRDTLRGNVLLGRTGIDGPAVREACELAGLAPLLETLPDGLDHPVGERGTALSGGQRQRVCLARALVGSPRLVLLDEATSALDPESEREVCERLAALRGATTIIAVSHRPAILEVADRVLRLEGGRLRGRAGPLLARAR